MERAVLVLSALLLNAIVLGPRAWYAFLGLPRLHQYIVSRIRGTERKLDRDHRSLKEREWRGAVMMVSLITFDCVLGGICGKLFVYDYRFLELVVLTLLLPVRPTWDCAWLIYQSLKRGNTASARQALEGTVWRHHAVLDEHSLARAAIEILAVGFSEKILAPVIWYILFGLPGLFVSKSVELVQETLFQPGNVKLGFGEGFSRATQTVHYVMNYIPCRISALMWLAALLFLPSGKVAVAAKQITASEIDLAAPRSVALIAAASALKLTLGGPSSAYTGSDWIGSGRVRAQPSDVGATLYLFALLHVFLFILLGMFL